MSGSQYGPIFEAAGKQYNVDPALLQAMASVESSGNPNATGAPTPYGQAQGLMQLLPSTAAALGVSDPKDPKQAIYGAAKLMAQNLARFPNVSEAVKAYYGGDNQKNWGPQTAAYPAKVAAAYSGLKSPMPQAATSAPSDPGQMSDAQLIAALTAGATATPASGPTAPAASGASAGASASAAPQGASASPDPSQMSDADLIKALTAGATDTPTSAVSGASATGAGQPQTFLGKALAADQAVGAGMIQGARDVVSSFDPAAQWLDKHVGSITLGGLLPTAAQAHQNSLADTQAYNQKYGNSGLAEAGRIAGDIGASVPVIASGEGLLGSAADAASSVPLLGRTLGVVAGAPEATGLARIGQGVARGALQGAAGNALISSTSHEPIQNQLLQGAEWGGALGSLAPAAGALGRKLLGGVASPNINPLRSKLAQKAVNDYGIPLRWSQISEQPAAKYIDSFVGKMPLSGLNAQNEAQGTAFTRAVAGTFGEDADKLTPEVMSAARSRIGKVFDDVAARTSIQDAPQNVLAPIGQIIKDASQELPDSQLQPLIKQLDNIGSLVNPQDKTISGDAYQSLTRKGSPLDRAATSPDPGIRYWSQQIKGVLDSALQQSAAPQDARALQSARLQWKNMRTVQDLAAKAGIEGEISPQALLGAVKKSYKDMAYSGAGDLGDLANIGKEFIARTPSSNTAENMAILDLLRGGGRSLGGLVEGGALTAGGLLAPVQTAATVGGVLASGNLMGRVLKSTTLRNRLLDAAAQGAPEIFGRPQVPGLLGRYAVPAAALTGQQLLALPAPKSLPPVAQP